MSTFFYGIKVGFNVFITTFAALKQDCYPILDSLVFITFGFLGCSKYNY